MYPDEKEGITSSKRPTVFAGLEDPLINGYCSGIDTEWKNMTLDGASVSPFISPYSIRYHPSSDLSEGKHSVTLKVRDKAQNYSDPLSWSFYTDWSKTFL